MIEFVPLASSSEGCCYLFGGGTLPPVMLDCGVSMPQIRAACAPGQLAGVLLSHAHRDHSRSYHELMRIGVDVYASEECWMALRPKSFRARICDSKAPFDLNGWTVTPFDAVHDESVATQGFVVAGDGCKLLYLTDSAYSPYRFDGLTHVAIEANWSEEILRRNHGEGVVHDQRFKRTIRTHMSIERAVEMLQANDLSKVREIWLLHLSDANSDERQFIDLVRKATGKPVYVACGRKEVASA